MNFITAIFRKPDPLPHVLMDIPMRSRDGQFSPSPKTLARQSRKASIVAGLAVYAATTTPEERAAETEAFFARSRSAGGR